MCLRLPANIHCLKLVQLSCGGMPYSVPSTPALPVQPGQDIQAGRDDSSGTRAQAALAAGPMTLITAAKPGNKQWAAWGDEVYVTAVFAIIVCASLGVIAVNFLSTRCLTKVRQQLALCYLLLSCCMRGHLRELTPLLGWTHHRTEPDKGAAAEGHPRQR